MQKRQVQKLTQEKPKMLILIPLIIIILLGGLTMIGCSPDPKKTMMSYMEKKYGEEFTFVNIGTQLWDRPYVEMILTNDEMPRGKYIHVHMDKETKEMSDNYICYLMQSQMDEYISLLVEPIYGANQVFSLLPDTLNGVPETVGKDASLDEYFKYIKSQITYSLYVGKEESTRNEDLEKLRSLLEAKECAINLSIRYVKDISIIGTIREQDHRNNVEWQEENVEITGLFFMENNYQFTRDIEWR